MKFERKSGTVEAVRLNQDISFPEVVFNGNGEPFHRTGLAGNWLVIDDELGCQFIYTDDEFTRLHKKLKEAK